MFGWLFFLGLALWVWITIANSKGRVARREANDRGPRLLGPGVAPDEREQIRRWRAARAAAAKAVKIQTGGAGGESLQWVADEAAAPAPVNPPVPPAEVAAAAFQAEPAPQAPPGLHPLQPTTNRFASPAGASSSGPYATVQAALNAPRPAQSNLPDYAAPSAAERTSTLPVNVTAAMPVSVLPTAATTSHAALPVQSYVPDYAPPAPTTSTTTLPDSVTAALPVSSDPSTRFTSPPPVSSGPVILGQGFNYKPQLVVSRLGQRDGEKEK